MFMNKIKTKYGIARLDAKGYYIVRIKGISKKLHRLIFEEFYNVDLNKEFPNFDIHHVDGNKTNNEIWNLDLIPHAEHQRLHRKGVKCSEETKIRISKAKNNSIGYYRVDKKKDVNCKQGFRYRYRYQENGKEKAMYSVDLDKLKAKVENKGLLWLDLNSQSEEVIL